MKSIVSMVTRSTLERDVRSASAMTVQVGVLCTLFLHELNNVCTSIIFSINNNVWDLRYILFISTTFSVDCGPLCEIYCEHGNKFDPHTGCPLCECNDPPGGCLLSKSICFF